MTTTTAAVTHRTFVQVQQDLAMKLEKWGPQVNAARENVAKLQLQLEDAIREMARLESIEAAIVREMDHAWEAQTDFESMELDRHHAEAEESLKAANDRLSELAQERADLEEDD